MSDEQAGRNGKECREATRALFADISLAVQHVAGDARRAKVAARSSPYAVLSITAILRQVRSRERPPDVFERVPSGSFRRVEPYLRPPDEAALNYPRATIATTAMNRTNATETTRMPQMTCGRDSSPAGRLQRRWEPENFGVS